MEKGGFYCGGNSPATCHTINRYRGRTDALREDSNTATSALRRGRRHCATVPTTCRAGPSLALDTRARQAIDCGRGQHGPRRLDAGGDCRIRDHEVRRPRRPSAPACRKPGAPPSWCTGWRHPAGPPAFAAFVSKFDSGIDPRCAFTSALGIARSAKFLATTTGAKQPSFYSSRSTETAGGSAGQRPGQAFREAYTVG